MIIAHDDISFNMKLRISKSCLLIQDISIAENVLCRPGGKRE